MDMFNIDDFKKKFSYLPLGMRLNNIGCVRNSKSSWSGSDGDFKGYVKFKNFDDGVRCLVLILCKYIFKYKLFGVSQIVSRYAPALDGNNVSNYAYFVQSICGLNRLSSIISVLRVQLPLVVLAIARMENGREFIEYSKDYSFIEYLSNKVQSYFDEYLEQVYYVSYGKVEKI